MKKKTIVVTGACGYVAQRMWPELSERYHLVALDVGEVIGNGTKLQDVRICDLTDPDLSRYREYFVGADAVLHCAFVSAPGLDATTWKNNSEAKFQAEYANVGMAYNVYSAALEAGVQRVVVASSNHAADYYERLIWTERMEFVTPEMAPYTDNFYGWSKIAYEQLGFVFATGQVGDRSLEVVQLRIGGPRDDADLDNVESGDLKRMHRGLGAYLSRRDQVQLFIQSLETEDIRNENGIPFQIFYGVSGNTHNFWSIVNARRVIDYQPQDNSQVNFADRIAQIAREVEA
jgi:nucleoside-diphosphate-sugar epimerase